MSRIIFISGVHGVGKGTLSEQVSLNTGITSFTASNLISEQKKSPTDNQKNVIDAEKNQQHLVTSIHKKLSLHEDLILDGHFTLWRNRELLAIPLSVFKNIPIKAIILVEEKPETIEKRLTKRDGFSRSIEELSEAIKQENNHARFVQKKLKVPMITVTSSQSAMVCDWIKHVFKKTF